MTKIYTVEVKILNKSLNQSFSYMIDFSLYQNCHIYDLVLVKFNNKYEVAIVEKKSILNEKPKFTMNSVLKILKTNQLNENQVELVEYLDNKLYSNKSDLSEIIIKKNNIQNNNLVIKLNNKIKKDELLNNDIINKYLVDQTKYKNVKKEYLKNINNYIEKDLIKIELQKDIIKKINVINFDKNNIELIEKTLKKSIQYKDRFYIKKDFLKVYNLSEYQYKKLKDLNLLLTKQIEEPAYENVFLSEELTKTKLSQKQQQAYEHIQNKIEKKPVLLHGITGSGKTAIFTKLIQEEIIKNKQVLILLPEITLSHQMIKHLEKEFGDVCVFFNNSLTKSQHKKILNKIQNNSAKIIISTRSGIFLNIPKLSLVIVDEEHDNSYKQNFYPYYHIDDMIDYWEKHNIQILLSSATPSLITYTKALKNIYELVELKTRYNDYALAKIKLKNYDQNDIVNNDFINEIKTSINTNENVLVLFNVKGYSRAIECPNCGNVEKCPNCNITLKYYKNAKTAECNYCDYKIDNYNSCSNCNEKHLKLIGLGIEKVQDELNKHFKGKIFRVDSQIAKTKNKVNNIIDQFNNSQGKILIGTQIIAKGLNFNNLNKVIVLNTDNMLYFNDFSAYENAYHLLEQVSGRSGRSSLKGEVIIYTNHKENYIYQAVQKHDYNLFYNEEMQNRKLQKTLPYYYICQIEFRATNVLQYEKEILKLKNTLDNYNLIVTKIIEPYINKVGDEYRLKIFVKYKKENIKKIIQSEIHKLDFKNIKILIDLNISSYGY